MTASTSSGSDVTVAAVNLLSTRGYESTTAEELADAVGMSRSTFFRRFGSKEDVVFADHDRLLARLEEYLGSTTLPPVGALGRAAEMVLDHHLQRGASARVRYELLRRSPTLRDREIVIGRRYERLFAQHVRAQVGDGVAEWVPVAMAASVVAVHNAVLRKWLRDPQVPATAELRSAYAGLSATFRPLLGGTEGGSSRVVVAVYDQDGAPDAVLAAVAQRLAGESAAAPS